MSSSLDFLRNLHLYGTSIWESMSSGTQKKLMKVAGGKVSTWSQQIGKKFRKFEKIEVFRNDLRMCQESFYVCFRMFYRFFGRKIVYVKYVFWVKKKKN